MEWCSENPCKGCPYEKEKDKEGRCRISDDTLTLLKEQPELVRCGDCVNGEPFDNVIMCNCEAHEKDWFCADGKRD